MPAEISTANEPAITQDVPGAGDLDAATQMVAEATEKYGPAPSDGEPSTEPTAATDDTGQPASGTQTPDDKGSAKRTEQMLAAQRKVLISFGIDPDSDIVDRFNQGLISRDELMSYARPVEQPKPETRLSASDRFEQFKAEQADKIRKGETITADDFLKSLELNSEIIRESKQLQQQAEVQGLINQCIAATENVIEADPLHKALPEDIRQIETNFFVASTDSVWSNSTNRDPNRVTPKDYNYFARRNLGGDYAKLRNAWIEYGKSQAARPAPPPAPRVNPISSNTGGAPMSPQQPMIRMQDGSMAEAARNYRPHGIGPI